MVSFSNFRTIDPATADVCRELIELAENKRSAFLPFISLWMAFNGWMESVTEAPNDALMIDSIVKNERVTNAYDLLMDKPEFRREVMRFSENWPVLNVREVRQKLGRDAFWTASREDLIDRCRREGVRLQPGDWANGDVPTWSQVLRTIYGVRCNLFHGAKSPQNRRDSELVQQSYIVLRSFIRLSGCLEWSDQS